MKTFLMLLLGFVAVSATLSGLLLLASPNGAVLQLSTDLLRNTPFHNYAIPGLILFLVVGGAHLYAIMQNLMQTANRYNWSMAAGCIIIGWVVVQIMLIGATHWLQLLYLVVGVLIFFIAYQLKGKWAV